MITSTSRRSWRTTAIFLGFSLAGACLEASAAAPATPIDKLRELVELSQYQDAYRFAKDQVASHGNPHFDFLYGLAAIQAGHAPEGVLALERHLSAVPANDRARVELARGYFDMGDLARARKEFEFVLRYNPPEAVQANIRRYLEMMQTRDTGLRHSSKAYIEVGGGHDSNVNAGTYNREIDLLSGPVVISDPNSREVGASYREISAGFHWVRRAAPDLAIFAQADVNGKEQSSAAQFDSTGIRAQLGFSKVKAPWLYRMSVSKHVLAVDSAKYRDTLAVTGEAQYSAGGGLTAYGFGQYAELRHQASNALRDARQVTLGTGVLQTLDMSIRPTIGLVASYTQDDNAGIRDDLSRGMTTLRATFAANLADHLAFSSGVSRQQSRYGLPDIVFGSVREDRTVSWDAGLNYALSPNWSVRMEYQNTDNVSNQNLYSYTRQLWALRTRYAF
jgi:tetratricopeptide (TPR) repeat protein